MLTEWTVTYGQHQIRVEQTPCGSARLYVDENLLDTTNDLYASGDEATLVGAAKGFVVEAFVTPDGEPRVKVNGQWVSNQVYAAASD